MATITAASWSASDLDALGQLALAPLVHPTRGLVEGHHGRWGARSDAAPREHDSQRQPLPFPARQIARVGVGEMVESQLLEGRARHVRGQLVHDAFVQQIVRRCLHEQRDVALGTRGAPGRLHDPGGHAQQGALPGPVAAQQRDRLAPLQLEDRDRAAP